MNLSYGGKYVSRDLPVQQMETPNRGGLRGHENRESSLNQEGAPSHPLYKKEQTQNINNEIENDKMVSNKETISKLVETEIEWPSLKDQIKDWIEEEYEMEESVVDYPAVTQVPIEVFPNPEAIWNFCVAYAATAMQRRARPDELIEIASGKVGIYYLAALTLFYSIEEASAGRIPPLQMLSEEMRDLLYACAPTNVMSRSWVVNWDDYNLITLLNGLPYNAYQNPGITLAPWLASENAQGLKALQTVKPNITFEDLNDVGPQAFEIIQRYILGSLDDTRLYPYTEDGDTTNIAMFAFSRDPTAVNPVDGFRQVVLEAPLRQRDLPYYSLNFFGDKNGRRDGWSPRTVQISTAPMMNLIMNGYDRVPTNLKYQTHMINFQSVLYNFLLEAVTAVFNSRDDRTIGGVTGGQFEDGYLDTLTAGQIITAVLQYLSRRYGIYSAWSAGTVLPEENCSVIGAGSRYVTTQYVDNYHTFLPLIEQIAGASSFLSVSNGTFLCPVLMTRGNKQTLDYETLGGNSLTSILKTLYPQLVSKNNLMYDCMAPGMGDLPDVIDLDPTIPQCVVSGSAARLAGELLNSAVVSLQAYCAIGAAVGSRDGNYHKALYITHYVSDVIDPIGFDITVLQEMVATLTTCPVSSRTIATSLSAFSPIMYGPKNANLLGAYQILYARNNSIQINDTYLRYRAAREIADGHKRAANINAPDEFSARIAQRTYVGEGGGFFSLLAKGGKVLDTGSRLFSEVLKLVAPNAHNKLKSHIERGKKGMSELLGHSPHLMVHFTPVEHQLVHPETLFMAVDRLEKNGKMSFDKYAPKGIKENNLIVKKMSSNNKNNKKKGGRSNNSKGRKGRSSNNKRY